MKKINKNYLRLLTQCSFCRPWSASKDPDDDGDDVQEDDGQAQALFCKKGKSKKKPRRKPNWSKAATNDLVDIVVNDSGYKAKLIFVNTKTQTNGAIYEAILQELKSRASARGENLAFNVNQVRTKFRKCMSICKQAALTIKISTGIKRFQEERELGEWFNQLFPVVHTRDSYQPEHAVEPPSSEGVDTGKNDYPSSSPGHEEATDSSTGTKMFVPKRSG